MFKFETMWTSHPELPNIISDAWNNNNNLSNAIAVFEKKATIWANLNFGNIFHRKKKILKRLQRI